MKKKIDFIFSLSILNLFLMHRFHTTCEFGVLDTGYTQDKEMIT